MPPTTPAAAAGTSAPQTAPIITGRWRFSSSAPTHAIATASPAASEMQPVRIVLHSAISRRTSLMWLISFSFSSSTASGASSPPSAIYSAMVCAASCWRAASMPI